LFKAPSMDKGIIVDPIAKEVARMTSAISVLSNPTLRRKDFLVKVDIVGGRV